MAQKRHKLNAEDRTDKAAAVRHGGRIPGVLYGHDLGAKSVQVTQKEFNKVFQAAGSTTLVNLTIGETVHPVLIREVQLHPLKDHVVHADFYQVRMNEKIRAHVPLEFIGESPAVKDLGGILVRNMDEVELEAFPQDLPHDIEVDISHLDTFDKLVHIADLKLPEGVELFHEPEEVVALVQAPRTEEELEQLSEEVSEDVSSVEGVEKKEVVEGEEGEPDAATEKTDQAAA